jgi:STE24 endopeptidase
MYLIVIGVLSIVLTLSSPLYRWVTAPGWLMSAVAGATLLPSVVGVVVNRRVLRALDRHPEHPAGAQRSFGRGMALVQGLLGVCHAGVLLCTDWQPLCRQTPLVGGWPLAPGLLALLPFLLSIVLIWIVTYPADRAVRQVALELYLIRGKPLRPVWALGQYVLYSLRHQVLFILVPMLLILAARDVVERYEGAIRRATRQTYAPDMLVGLAALLVAVIAPEILRHVWVTQRLPDGPLRDRLTVLCRRLRLRCREILVWRSGGMLVNAAVMGVVAPLRYVLITDGMLEQMDDTSIEAVFGHEAGHVKRHHILYFLLFALVSGSAVAVFTVRSRGLSRPEFELAATVVGALLLVKWGLLFGWVSRRFERQADVYGLRALALTGLPCTMPCALHAPAGNPAPAPPSWSGDALCSTAAQVFGDALHEVALLNGIQPEARSWRHSSISSRARFLQELALDPRRTRRFERSVLAAKAAILVAALAGALWAAAEMNVWGTVIGLLDMLRR